MGLHVEDELVAFEGVGGRCGIEARLFGQHEAAAAIATRRERVIEGQERRRGAAQRLHEGASGHADALGVDADPLAASAFARATTSDTGTGRNSPFEVASILIGNRPRGMSMLIADLPTSASPDFRAPMQEYAFDGCGQGESGPHGHGAAGAGSALVRCLQASAVSIGSASDHLYRSQAVGTSDRDD